MFLKLLQFEYRYHSKQVSFYLFLFLFLLLGFALYIEWNNHVVNGNGPYRTHFFISAISVMSIFPILFFSINALLRDQRYGFEELLFSTAIPKMHYFLSRLIGVFGVALLVSSVSIIGFYFGQYYEDQYQHLGDFQLLFYVWPWLVFLLPNVFICTTIIFSVTLLTRNVVVTYLSAVLLLAFFWMSSFYINSPLTGGSVLAGPAILDIMSIVDAFGLAAFFEQSQFWTTYEKNRLLIQLSGPLFWNRLLWLALSVAFAMGAYALFSFRKRHQRSKKAVVPSMLPPLPKYRAIETVNDNYFAQWKGFCTQFKMDFVSLFYSKAFIGILLTWMAINVMSIYFIINGEAQFGDRYPVTSLIVGLITEPAEIIGLLLILFYCGELVWKKKACQFNEILDSTALSNCSFLFSKYAVISLMIVLLFTVGIHIGIGFQAVSDYRHFNIMHYFSMYYYNGLPLFLMATFAIFLQTILPNKYGAMIVAGLLLLLFGQLAPSLGIKEPMIRFLYFPRIANRYSDMTGYGQYVKPFHAFLIYWSALIAIMVLLTAKWWNRGYESRLARIRRTISKPWSRLEKGGLYCFGLIFLLAGSYIYYNLHYLSPAPLSDDPKWFNEQFERRFKIYESLPVPQIVDVKTAVDIFPKERKYTIQAHYIIENTSEQAIHEIFVCTRQKLHQLRIEKAEKVFKDSLLNSYLFHLRTPLPPKGQLAMTFQVEEQITGFATSLSILSNGSYIRHQSFDPLLGYADFLEISDPRERKRRGLPERKMPGYNDPHLQANDKFSQEKVRFETIVSTAKDQTAIASGQLIRQWKENGRNYFHYQATPKIRKTVTYFSARYEQRVSDYKGVSIEMYYHPEHYHNIEAMMEVTKTTLDYATVNFGPYQHDHLRIAEVAGARGFGGQAMPGTISMSEKSMYTKDVRNPTKGINVVARRTIHEVAHQWWGHQLSPKQVAGARLLTEALVKYTEAVVLEKLYGKAMVRRLTDYTARKYFSGRAYARSAEPPLYLADRQRYLGYDKGYMVLLALKELLGEVVLNQALQNLLKKHREAPTATSQDLLKELYAVAPPKHHSLIDDWMKRVITYDLKVAEANYKRLHNGKYEVNISISAKRYESLESGQEIAVPIDEPIQIGLFLQHPNLLEKEEAALYLQTHQINQPMTSLKIITDELSAYIGIDPYLSRLDKNREDNLKILE